MPARRTLLWLTAIVLAACARPGTGASLIPMDAPIDSVGVYALLDALAADSMEGRGTGTVGGVRAARFIAERMASVGLMPAGDSGFFQRVPIIALPHARGEFVRYALLNTLADLDTVPAERRRPSWNVVGIIPGTDPALRDEAVIIGAHYDHLGMRASRSSTDSIYNGADDDASGTIAVLEIARQLGRGPRPRRTLIFLVTTAEEIGLLGTRYYIRQPVRPIERTVADLQIEMVGRPDSLAGGRGKAWLTGYERSTMGDMLAANGIPIVPDKRLDQDFFNRSDNIAFAMLGIPAHTLSSFNMHSDYHRPTDDMRGIDAGHMAEVIRAAVRAVRLLADGIAPQWKPGGRPS